MVHILLAVVLLFGFFLLAINLFPALFYSGIDSVFVATQGGIMRWLNSRCV